MEWIERLGGEETIIAGVLKEFEGFCEIPHPSWGEEALCEALRGHLKRRGLDSIRDEIGNIMCEVPATPGRERAPVLVLQGHVDMVCVAAPGSNWDPARDRVNRIVEDGYLRSDGRSSLGADNNLANAVVLWLLDQNVPHGPLRILFTVAEEVGLEGAKLVDPSWLLGASALLNTDGFHLGRMVVSSAGGRRETFTRLLDTEPAPKGVAYTISLTGFTGGHSGDDICRDRGNPIQTMARFCKTVDVPFALADLRGGQGFNVIPTEVRATIVLEEEEVPRLKDRVDQLRMTLQRAYFRSDPGLELTFEPAPMPEEVWTKACTKATLTLLTGMHHGVSAWHRDFPDVPSASSNAARVWVEEGSVCAAAFLRCTTAEQESRLSQDHRALAERCGFMEQGVSYPGWVGDKSNPLARLMAQVCREEMNMEAEITAVHVGLEPSVLQSKAPNLVMVSTGTDILDAHSVDERAPVASLPPYAALLAGTMDRIGQMTGRLA